jgi:hypothetical protein
MTKNQKIWLAVFLAMFLIPEILWSPYSSFYYSILFSNFGNSFQSIHLLPTPKLLIIQKSILLIQFFGLLLSLFVFAKSAIKNKLIKLSIELILIILILSAFYFLLFTFNFNPKIG